MSDKIKIISGIFKGLESYDQYFDMSMHSDGIHTITFRVDQRNKITVDLKDVELPETRKKYLFYLERFDKYSEFVGVFNLTEKEMYAKSGDLFLKLDKYIVVADEVDKIDFTLNGKRIYKNDLKKVLESI